jgi:hypothetical protein
MSWGPEQQGLGRISIWEPERHLQTTWFEPTEIFGPAPNPAGGRETSLLHEDPQAAARLAVDYFLEGRGGRTVLRLVHSGFGKDSKWDEDYDAHLRGWTFELRSLRNYLENHRGKTRHIAWVRKPIGQMKKEEVWSRLLGREALLREGSLEGAKVGDRFAITTVHGDRLEGEVRIVQPPIEFAGTVENLDHSLLRCGIESCAGGPPQVQFWLSTWGGPGRADTFRRRWNETLTALFGS